MSESLITRLLVPKDIDAWKQLRLEMLDKHPEAYGASYDEEKNRSEEDWHKNIMGTKILGGWVGSELVASVALYHWAQIKTSHKAVIWGVYTKPKFRRNHICYELMKKQILMLDSQIKILQLCCNASNSAAYEFYLKFGFQTYGTEQKALKVGDVYYDEHLMFLELNES